MSDNVSSCIAPCAMIVYRFPHSPRPSFYHLGDIILVGLRDFQDGKADVIQRYNPDEARKLKARGELPDNLEVDKADKGGAEDEVPFDFGDL